MLNEYELLQIMKFRNEETERTARNAWKFFANPIQKKERKKSGLSGETTCTSSLPCA